MHFAQSHSLLRCKCQQFFPSCRNFLKTRIFDKNNSFANVTEGLKHLYKTKLLPLEEKYFFHDFYLPKITDQDFDAKPMILLMGQYSTGKTTLIKYLINGDFPGMRIGPEPTTDKFIVVMHGEKEGYIPGNALVADSSKPFTPLSSFGNSFLNRLQCSLSSSPRLGEISFIDTPGILSGEKQRIDRGYDFTGVLEWFAERVDRIILLFDANKLDISDEFRRSIEILKVHDEKIRIVLNKADRIGHQELLRVYGALMWSLGKVLRTPEVSRVYVGSFWDQPLQNDMFRKLFEDEEMDLMKDIQSLPRNNTLRKLNDISKRARLAKTQAYLIAELGGQMPTFNIFSNKAAIQENLIDNLASMFQTIQGRYRLSPGDFPQLEKAQEKLRAYDFSKFPSLNEDLINAVDEMMMKDLPQIMSNIPAEESKQNEFLTSAGLENTPFGYDQGVGINEGKSERGWVVEKYRQKYDSIYDSLAHNDNKIVVSVAREEMMKSKLPSNVLGKIWNLADVDGDGVLDRDEFALSMHLIDIKLKGHELPDKLPEHLIPPSKKNHAPSRP
nr:PREDICTED: EH domain-containing protein 1-like [Bemisia tabaci]